MKQIKENRYEFSPKEREEIDVMVEGELLLCSLEDLLCKFTDMEECADFIGDAKSLLKQFQANPEKFRARVQEVRDSSY